MTIEECDRCYEAKGGHCDEACCREEYNPQPIRGKKPNSSWTEVEDSYLYEVYGWYEYSMGWLRDLLPHRTERAIRARARKLGFAGREKVDV